jgi:hypothetical protein
MKTLNLEIEEARAKVHNIRCVASILKRLFNEPIACFDEFETEGALDQLDEICFRCEQLDHYLETLKTPPKQPLTSKLEIPEAGNGNRKLQEFPTLHAVN